MQMLARTVAGFMLALATLTPVAALAQEVPPAQGRAERGTRLILLGTAGGPVMRANRSQMASLLVVDGRPYLIDCGEGTVAQLKKAGFDAADINRVFLTHLHFDHTAGLASLIAFGWSMGNGAEFDVMGPPGTRVLTDRAVRYFGESEAIFSAEIPGKKPMSQIVRATDLDITAKAPTVIYQDDRLRVLAVENSHFSTLPRKDLGFGTVKSYSLRFETADRVVVFSGDTGVSPAFEVLAKGADILVSEVMDVDGTLNVFRSKTGMAPDALKAVEAQMRAKHLAPDDIGTLASRAHVGMVVLSHIAPGGDEEKSALPYTGLVRKNFRGPVVLGRDLDEY